MKKPIVVGSVAYDPKIVTIWDIIRDYFNDNGVRLDYVLFSNYEAQIEYLLSGKIDIAWNTNVAWIRAYELSNHKAQALLMRDTDIDFKSVFIAKEKSGTYGWSWDFIFIPETEDKTLGNFPDKERWKFWSLDAYTELANYLNNLEESKK